MGFSGQLQYHDTQANPPVSCHCSWRASKPVLDARNFLLWWLSDDFDVAILRIVLDVQADSVLLPERMILDRCRTLARRSSQNPPSGPIACLTSPDTADSIAPTLDRIQVFHPSARPPTAARLHVRDAVHLRSVPSSDAKGPNQGPNVLVLAVLLRKRTANHQPDFCSLSIWVAAAFSAWAFHPHRGGARQITRSRSYISAGTQVASGVLFPISPFSAPRDVVPATYMPEPAGSHT